MQLLRESRSVDCVVLLSSPSMEGVAQRMLDAEPDLLRKGQIKWGKFEDGFPNLFIDHVESVRGRDVVFLASFLDQKDILPQLSVLYTLPKYMVRSLLVLLPYFPTGTMERVDSEGQIATAYTLARMLSAIPITSHGPAKLMIYDIHALQNRFYFGDAIIPLLVSAVPMFINTIKKNHSDDKIVIAFPDDGAQKRFGGMFPKEWPLVICQKVRDGNKRIVTIKEGAEHLKGAHVFIVDDLTKTGGTLIQCRNELVRQGAPKVSAYVTHGVFPQDSWKRFTEDEGTGGFERFYVTDSCPESVERFRDRKPFVILSIATSLVHNTLRY